MLSINYPQTIDFTGFLEKVLYRHSHQLKQEDLIPLADWGHEALLEVIYAALTKEGWPVYLFLPEQTSLLVLDNSQACPVYSQNEAWLERLTALLDQEGLLMTD